MTGRDDAVLVSAAQAGDTAAFGEMFDRYGQGIYSFCLSRLRNAEQAADATQNVFVRAIEKIDGLRNPERLRAWLFAIAQRQIVDAARIRTRMAPGEMDDMADESVDLAADLIAAEHAELLWDAAGSLQPRDLELLELEYRHGLEGNDLADSLGVTPSHLHVLQSRLRDRVGAAVGALVLARTGSGRCVDLAGLLDGWDGQFTLDLRSRLTRHANGCDACGELCDDETRSQLRFSLLPLAAVPLALRARTVIAMETASSASASASTSATSLTRPDHGLDDWGWRHDGFPTPRGAMRIAPPWKRIASPALAVAAVVLLIVTGALIVGGRASSPDVVVSGPPAASSGTAVAIGATDPPSTVPALTPTTGAGPTSNGAQLPVDTVPSTSAPADDSPPVDSVTSSTLGVVLIEATTSTTTTTITSPLPSATSTTTTSTTTVANLAPSIGRITIEDPVCAGEPATLLVAASDVDDDIASLTATTPAGTFGLSGDGPYIGEVELGAVGTVEVTITVTDDSGSSVSETTSTQTALCLSTVPSIEAP